MQYNKVEISGVNTSRLKTLKENEKIELVKRAHEGDKQAREELIICNLRLVLSVLQKYLGRGECPDDLFQVGVIGLIKAIDNFDTSLQVKFSTYAVPMIAGELRRHLRDNSPVRVSRSLRDMAFKAMQSKEKLTSLLQREPTISEIANDIGAQITDVVMALESITEPLSLYEPVFSDSGDDLYVLDQISDKTDDQGWLDELSLKEALQNLCDREKNILYMRYLKGKTQVEVAKQIGISQAQVSRLEKGALDSIKVAILTGKESCRLGVRQRRSFREIHL